MLECSHLYCGPQRLAALLLLALIAGTLLLIPGLRRDLEGLSRREETALALIVLGALGLRLALAPMTVLAENLHAYRIMDVARRLSEDQAYGAVYFVLHHYGMRLLGPEPEDIFHFSALLGALSCLPAWLWLRAALPASRPLPALIAAGLTAVLPLHLLHSGTESQHLCMTLFLLSALAFTQVYLRSGRRGALVLASLYICAAAQCRPEGWLCGPLFALYLLLQLPGSARGFKDPAILGAGALAALVCAWPLWMVFEFRLFGGGSSLPMLRLGPEASLRAAVSSSNVWLDGRWTPLWLPITAAFGVWRLDRDNPRALMALLTLAGVFLYLVVAADHVVSMRIRYQFNLWFAWVLLAATALAWPMERWSSMGLRTGTGAGYAALAAAALLHPGRNLAHGPQQAHAFFMEARAQVSEPVLWTAGQQLGVNILVHLPWCTQFREDAPECQLRYAHDALPDGLPEGPFAYYRGLACYSFSPPAQPDLEPVGLRPECRSLEAGLRLTPLAEKRLRRPEGRPYAFVLGEAEPKIGFYRAEKISASSGAASSFSSSSAPLSSPRATPKAPAGASEAPSTRP